jgi:predicted nuclease with TOPRIM domain
VDQNSKAMAVRHSCVAHPSDAPAWALESEMAMYRNPFQSIDHLNQVDLKARNRIASKKWREKKNDFLHELEAENEQLRQQAWKLRDEVTTLRAECGILDHELSFFQAFISKMMNPKQERRALPGIAPLLERSGSQ